MKQKESISLEQSRAFSKLMRDYISNDSSLKDFYFAYPSQENTLEQASIKVNQFEHRNILVSALENQYQELDLHSNQKRNLEALKNRKTLTITTGHQLNLFTGPVFFFYKILQVIKMCEVLNKNQEEFYFVPFFWMATEDHDFEEINHFYFQNRKFVWDRNHSGAVGRLDLENVKTVFDSFLNFFPNSHKKNELENLIEKSYLNNKNLTEATRSLVQELFAEFGLLTIDGDSIELKKLMIPIFEQELIHQKSFENIQNQSKKLSELNYKIQVHPREINLFYLKNNIRERLVFEDNLYKVLNSDLSFSNDEILKELHQNPERFSPNVVLRPVYQETILPNVAYVGGGGEIAYWLQLKSNFDALNVPFPLLFLRNSLLILNEKQKRKQTNLHLENADIFLPSDELVKSQVEKKSTLMDEILPYEDQLIHIFDELENLAQKTNPTFGNMLQAQRTKQLKGFLKLKKRLMKAETKQYEDLSNQLIELKNEIFPNHELQERYENFSSFWLDYGSEWINLIYDSIEPFSFGFQIKTIENKVN